MRQDAVICGYTEPKGRRKYIGALVLGAFTKGVLVFIGQVGVGFDREMLEHLRDELKARRTKGSPFYTVPKTNAPVQWVFPELVCEVAFREWTRHRIMRFPIFVGLKDEYRADDAKIP